jgi:hypothetical protein
MGLVSCYFIWRLEKHVSDKLHSDAQSYLSSPLLFIILIKSRTTKQSEHVTSMGCMQHFSLKTRREGTTWVGDLGIDMRMILK